MAVDLAEFDRMPTAQVECAARGLRCLRGELPEPVNYFVDDDGNLVMRWTLGNFNISLLISQGGVPSTNVHTIGRIEDMPLVAGLMRFNQMLISAFELGKLPPQ